MSEQIPPSAPESANETLEVSKEQVLAFNNLYRQIMLYTASGGKVKQLDVGENRLMNYGLSTSDYREGASDLTAKIRLFALEGKADTNGTNGGIMTTVVGEDGLSATGGILADIYIWGNIFHDTEHTYVLRNNYTVDHWRSMGDADPDFDEAIHKISPISSHTEPELVGKLDIYEMQALQGKLEHSTPE